MGDRDKISRTFRRRFSEIREPKAVDEKACVVHDPLMLQGSAASEYGAAQRLAAEMFLMAAGPALVKRVAEILGAHRIPVMPLKGVLLQRLVYGEKSYRPISDVDLLVPEPRFLDAHAALRAAGFTEERWEDGHWQVTMRNPEGPPLGVDLHRRLSRTSRSHLTPAGLFERGTSDARLFDTSVAIPCGQDLLAHLLLHATLDWLNLGKLHRARDFQTVGEALSLNPGLCVEHLKRQGLVVHALLMLPAIAQEAGGSFVKELTAAVARAASVGASCRAFVIQAIAARFEPGHPARRLAGPILAPSLMAAVVSATRDRLVPAREPVE
jgi:hypothetical protein